MYPHIYSTLYPVSSSSSSGCRRCDEVCLIHAVIHHGLCCAISNCLSWRCWKEKNARIPAKSQHHFVSWEKPVCSDGSSQSSAAYSVAAPLRLQQFPCPPPPPPPPPWIRSEGGGGVVCLSPHFHILKTAQATTGVAQGCVSWYAICGWLCPPPPHRG